jgi:hypothetical protein
MLMWNFSLKNHNQTLIRDLWMIKIEPYIHKSLTYIFFQISFFLEVYIFGICRWAPIYMDFIVFDIWNYYYWTLGTIKFQKFKIVKWTFVDSCFFKKWGTLEYILPTHQLAIMRKDSKPSTSRNLIKKSK